MLFLVSIAAVIGIPSAPAVTPVVNKPATNPPVSNPIGSTKPGATEVPATPAPTVAIKEPSAEFNKQIASVMILFAKKAQEEVRITEAQRAKMNTHLEAFRKEQQAYGQELQKASEAAKKPAERDLKREEQMLAGFKGDILSVLKPDQIKRLREISLQEMGVTALADDTVSKFVGLRPDQLKKVRDILTKGFTDAGKISNAANERVFAPYKGKGQPKDEAEAKKWDADLKKRKAAEEKKVAPQLEKIRTNTITQVTATLTADQKKTWAFLQGTPIKK